MIGSRKFPHSQSQELSCAYNKLGHLSQGSEHEIAKLWLLRTAGGKAEIGLSDGIRGENLLPLSETTWTRWDVAAVPEGGFGLETGTSLTFNQLFDRSEMPSQSMNLRLRERFDGWFYRYMASFFACA